MKTARHKDKSTATQPVQPEIKKPQQYVVVYLDDAGLSVMQRNDMRAALAFIAKSGLDRSEYVLMAGEILAKPSRLKASNKLLSIDDEASTDFRSENESFITALPSEELNEFIRHNRSDHDG